MWMVWLLGFFLFATDASAEFGFDEKYERDYNIFNPANQCKPDNALNSASRYNPSTLFAPLDRQPNSTR